MQALFGALLRHHEVILRDTKVLDVCFELLFDQAFEPVVDLCVLESVLFCVFEDHAVLLDEGDDGVLPDGRRKVLGHDLKDPLLSGAQQTVKGAALLTLSFSSGC